MSRAVAILLASFLLSGCGSGEPASSSTMTGQSSFDDLASVLQKGSPAQQEQAVELLAKHHEDKAKGLLAEALETGDGGVRLRAAHFFALHPDKEGRAPLLDLLQDPESEVRQEAAIALGMMNEPAAIPVLKETFAAAPDLGVSLRVAKALGALATPEAGEALISRLDDRDELLRIAILTGLQEIDPLPLPTQVQACAADREPTVRIQLATILWRARGRPEATELALALLGDEDENVRFAAANSLKLLADPAASFALQKTASEDRSDRVRREANSALSAVAK